LKSKFRVKAKRAYAKSRQLVVRPLDADDIVRYQPRLQQLHAEVVGQAGFRLDGGCVGAFAPLRRSLGSSFVVHGYFLDDELVGYLTAFVRPGRLDAHSVGFDYALNREHSIYPRMLYDYLRIAMERGLGMVDYGRTAQEIKSTVGAVPVPTRSWVRHRSEWINPVLGWLLEGIEPEVQPQRQPFKAVAAARSAA
jgi:hypothetical protein